MLPSFATSSQSIRRREGSAGPVPSPSFEVALMPNGFYPSGSRLALEPTGFHESGGPWFLCSDSANCRVNDGTLLMEVERGAVSDKFFQRLLPALQRDHHAAGGQLLAG